jgi:DNA-binding NarL/FixJ family response regulator
MSHPPLIVLEGAAGAAEREAARLRAAGFEVVEGFRSAAPRGRPVVRTGAVTGASDAADALLAAIGGAGLLVEATANRDTIDLLVDDLRRLGPVDHRVATDEQPAALDPDGRALLALLAEGLTLGEAAEQLGLPRRTADRRLAAARRALGTERTAEALARARRLGWLS